MKCVLYKRHFLNMAMSRYTSNSNACILQKNLNIKMLHFEVKTKIFGGFLSIHDRDICKLNNSALNLKQVK